MVKFALNFLSKVVIRETDVLTHFTVILHQTKKAAIYINELGGGEGRRGGEEERRMGEKERSEERREEGGEKIGGKIRERGKIKVYMCQTRQYERGSERQ